MIQPLRTERLSERVSEVLKSLIHEEGFKPGDKFYSENQLIARLKVSRSSIREAVRILEATGWVTVQHGKGIFIARQPLHGFEAFKQWLKNNKKDILENFEVRLLIDPKAAYYAALRGSEQDLILLTHLCEEYSAKASTATVEQMIKLDEQFHASIAKATKNRTLSVLMKTMTTVLFEGWISSLHIPGRIQSTIEEHRRVLEAILKRDPQGAEQAMRDHLTRALQDIQSSMET
ncbi:MAG: FadR family transcriptional regulator [Spirochaetes bacterium]|nr:FadR family transcriptional regulator [Spirochaetota bacterium]